MGSRPGGCGPHPDIIEILDPPPFEAANEVAARAEV